MPITSQVYSTKPRSRTQLRLRGVFDISVATLAYCVRHAGPLFVIAWLPCLIESASRLTLEWLSVSPGMPQWLLSHDFDPPTWLTAFAVTPWAAMAWAFVLGTMADRGSKRGMIEISGTPVRWVRLEFSPAVLVAAAIFSATNLVDAALRFAERSVPTLLLGDAGLSDLAFDVWGVFIVTAHIVVMAAVMAWSYPAAGLVLRTGKFDIRVARRVLRGNVMQITAVFVLLTLVLVALDRALDVPKTWLVRLLAPSTPWNLRETLMRYALDFPLSMAMIVSWAVAVGIVLDEITPRQRGESGRPNRSTAAATPLPRPDGSRPCAE